MLGEGENLSMEFNEDLMNITNEICYLGRHRTTPNFIINGYLFPSLACVTVVINCTILVVFWRAKFFTPHHALLAALAIVDMLTVFIPSPLFMYVFGCGFYMIFPSCKLCQAYDITTMEIPIILHSISMWLTLGLAIQRHVCVSNPFKAKYICTMKNTIIYMILMSCCFFAFLLPFTFRLKYEEVLVNLDMDGFLAHPACRKSPQNWLNDNKNLFYGMYGLLRVLVIKLLPCVILLILEIKLIRNLKMASLVRIHTNKVHQRKDVPMRLSAQTAWIVGIFLVTEIPVTVGVIHEVIAWWFKVKFMKDDVKFLLSDILNFILLFGCMANFVIYIFLSEKFRRYIIKLVTFQSSRKRQYRQYKHCASLRNLPSTRTELEELSILK